MSGRSRRQITAHHGITRWVRPKPFEPAHGHLLRLAAAHDEWDARGFADHVGVGWINDPQACLEAVGAARFATDADRERLARWTPHFGGCSTMIGGERFRSNDWSVALRRHCPGCMAEEAYHRTWFDLTFIDECPLHGLPLLDAGGEPENQFMRAGAVAEVVGCGAVRSTPLRSTPRDGVATYALGRLGVLPNTRNELLDPYTMREILEALELVGRLRLAGRRRNTPRAGRLGIPALDLQTAGYAVLSGGRTAMADLAREIAASAPAGTLGAQRLFGWAHRGFVAGGGLSRALWDVMSDVASSIGQRARGHGWPDRPGMETLATREIAELHGVRHDAVVQIARKEGLLVPYDGRRTPYHVARQDADAIMSNLEQLMTRTEAASALGLDEVTFTKLSAAGYIAPAPARWREQTSEGRYHLGDYIGFLETIPCIEIDYEPPNPGEDDPYMPLGDALALSRYDPVEAMDDIHAGNFSVYGRREGRLSLNDVFVEPGVGDHGHPFTKRLFSPAITRVGRGVPEGMTQREACTLLDAPPETVLALAELGFFGGASIGSGGSRRKLGRAEVEAFAAEWAAGKAYAGVLGIQASWVRARLAERGIVDLFVERGVDPRRMAPFYRRADMRRGLGLAHDPDGKDGRKAYWRRFSAFLEANRVGFGVWSTADPTSTLCSTSDRAWPVHLSVHRALDRPPWPAAGTPAGHGIEAVLRIDASRDVPRLTELAAAVRERRFMRGIEHRLDEEAGTLVASLSTIVTMTGGSPTVVSELTARVEATEFRLMQRMLLTLRGSFETGTRPYDHRCFGAWPHEAKMTV